MRACEEIPASARGRARRRQARKADEPYQRSDTARRPDEASRRRSRPKPAGIRAIALLLLASAAGAQDYERAKAVCAEAKELRRGNGYVAAIDFLEPRLDHPRILHAYVDCCRWGGQEARGLRGIGGARVAEADRLAAEIRLLQGLYRFREAAEAARRLAGLGSPDHAAWARGELAFAEKEAALRDRLRARARRAAWASAAGVLVLLGAWALIRRGSPPASSPARA